MQHEALRHAPGEHGQRTQHILAHPCVDRRGDRPRWPGAAQVGWRWWRGGAHVVERRLEPAVEVGQRRLRLLGADVTPAHERLRVELAYGTMGLDPFVHER